MDDKLSIKNLLFTKAIPNYELPIAANSCKVFGCTDCGDKFLFESSYQDHCNRKSVQITYTCRHCNLTKIFYNRCNLLSHIRSHGFKTATINALDLNVDPIPLNLFKNTNPTPLKPNGTSIVCYECKVNLAGTSDQNRVSHFMMYTNEVLKCPVCLFIVPTSCALKAHLRFHLKFIPYFCPECGMSISSKNLNYPFSHNCQGFRMMRATARIKCVIEKCPLLHPNDFKDHMKKNHIKKVYKCPICVVACFNETTMLKHLKIHAGDPKTLIFYQCELCPGRLVLMNLMDNHLRTHANGIVFPCWTCGAQFNEPKKLIQHQIAKHEQTNQVKQILTDIITEFDHRIKPKRVYRVVKRCDQCNRNFTYKCKYDEIPVLPNECPYKCSSKMLSNVAPDESDGQLTCFMCKSKMSSDWKEIKKHYALFHNNYRCLDPKLVLSRVDVRKHKHTKQKAKKRVGHKNIKTNEAANDADVIIIPDAASSPTSIKCNMCDETFDHKELLEKHMVNHRDMCMAYQCMECGKSFVVKPSFSKHLLLEHQISDVEQYIKEKMCYNEIAFEKHPNVPIEPLKENQCNVCREQFNNTEDLEKHIRVHGMAFLLKNASK